MYTNKINCSSTAKNMHNDKLSVSIFICVYLSIFFTNEALKMIIFIVESQL